MEQEKIVEKVAKDTGLSVEKVMLHGQFFDSADKLFEYLFLDELEEREDILKLIQEMSSMRSSDFSGFDITVAEKMVVDHEHVMVVESEDGEVEGYVYLPV